MGRAILVLACSIMFAVALNLLALPTEADGCAVASREHVRISEESAIIVWDAPTKTLHFIRRATFFTRASDFGFLVPTPTQPALAEVSDTAFSSLESAIKPKVVEVSGGFKFMPLCCVCVPIFGARHAAAEAPAGVRVLDAQRVGGFDAVVLEADDAQALRAWLKEHGYPSQPELVSWLSPYVSDEWKITAFKIAQDPKSSAHVRTAAVRMSFKTDRPFFPYREPAEKKDKTDTPAWQEPRLLRVFFVGAERAVGKRGGGDWEVRVPWADRLDDAQRGRLIEEVGVPAEHIPAGAWLTTFEDTSAPRLGTDEVYFEPSAEQTVIHPPEIVRRRAPIWIPWDLVSFLLVAAALGVWVAVRLRRRPRSTAAEGIA
jgi:hypothetical protein